MNATKEKGLGIRPGKIDQAVKDLGHLLNWHLVGSPMLQAGGRRRPGCAYSSCRWHMIWQALWTFVSVHSHIVGRVIGSREAIYVVFLAPKWDFRW